MKGEKNHEFNLYLFWRYFHDCRFYVCVWERTYSLIFLEKYAAGRERKNENHWFVVAMIVWFIVAGFDLWYIEKSARYYKK